MTWLTPNYEAGMVSRPLVIPEWLVPIVTGCLDQLTREYNWEKFGDIDVSDALDAVSDMMDIYFGGNPMIGTLVQYGTSACPSNCIPCDGVQRSRVDYPELYAVLDAAFIDDEDNFTLPDMSGNVVVGANGDIGATGGESEVTLGIPEIPPHDHTIPYQSCFPYGEIPEVCVVGGVLTQTTGQTGGGQPHNNMQPYVKFGFGMVYR